LKQGYEFFGRGDENGKLFHVETGQDSLPWQYAFNQFSLETRSCDQYDEWARDAPSLS
jgi:hypothetical protein